MHFLVNVNKNNDLTADWREPFKNRRSSSGRDNSSYIDHRTTRQTNDFFLIQKLVKYFNVLSNVQF